MRTLAVLLTLTAIAHADRQTAQQLEKDATSSKDRAMFDACGREWLDVANAEPTARDLDELLFESGQCFYFAKSLGAATMAFKQLRTRAPNSKFNIRGSSMLAEIDQAAGLYFEAAKELEDYAKKFPAENDAPDALHNAIVLRTALGDDRLAIDDGKLWIRRYGAKQPGPAGEEMASLVPLYLKQSPAAAVAHITETLKNTTLSPTTHSSLLAKRAELLWDQTCPGRALCVSVLPADKAPRCQPGPRMRVDKRRDPKAAIAALQDVVAYADSNNEPLLRHDAAVAKLRLADGALEAYFALDFPSALDFSPAHKDDSTKRFNAWIKDRTRLGGEAQHQYEAVLMYKDADAAITAAARIGQLTESFWATLRSAEIPKDVRTGDFTKDKVAAFCEQMTSVAEPLGKRALEAFDVCQQKSIQLQWESASTQLCRREAAVIDPTRVALEPKLPRFIMGAPAPAFVPPAPATAKDAYAKALAGYEARACPTFVPTTPDGRYLAGLIAISCKDEVKARQLWTDANTAPALVGLGVLALKTEDFVAALELFQRAAKLDGKLWAAHYGIARALRKTGDKHADQELFELHSAMITTDDPGPRVALFVLALESKTPGIARLFLDRGDTAYDKLMRANWLVRDGQWSAALPLLEKAEDANLGSYDLALALVHDHRYEAALAAMTRFEKLARFGYEGFVVRGLAHLGLGNMKEARTDLEEAIRIDPTDDAKFDLALIK